MPVGLLTLELHIEHAQSLKDKRQVLRSLKDRLRAKFNVAVAELEYHDTWQRSVVGIVLLFGLVFGSFIISGGKIAVILEALPHEMMAIGGAGAISTGAGRAGSMISTGRASRAGGGAGAAISTGRGGGASIGANAVGRPDSCRGSSTVRRNSRVRGSRGAPKISAGVPTACGVRFSARHSALSLSTTLRPP